MTVTATPASTDPGVLRGLQRVLSEDGFIQILAIDHGLDIAELLAADKHSVPFSDVTAAKDLVIRAAAPVVSAVLVDAAHGGHLLAAGSLPAGVGLAIGVEDEDYQIPPGARNTRLREGWGLQQLRNLGADMAKLLWWYRPDAPNSEGQLALLDDLLAEAHACSVPIVVEPIWYPLEGEQPQTPEWKAARVRGIIESAVEIDRRGSDLLKLEFPGYLDSPSGRAAAVDAVAELDERTSAPWTILSAGVDYETFVAQVEIAAAGGGSGYLAGRSIWRDPLKVDAAHRAEAVEAVRGRFERLNEVLRSSGRPIRPFRSLDHSISDLGSEWYRP